MTLYFTVSGEMGNSVKEGNGGFIEDSTTECSSSSGTLLSEPKLVIDKNSNSSNSNNDGLSF